MEFRVKNKDGQYNTEIKNRLTLAGWQWQIDITKNKDIYMFFFQQKCRAINPGQKGRVKE